MSVVQTQLDALTVALPFLLHPQGSVLYHTCVRLRQCPAMLIDADG